jgi:hypothetical protein
MKSYDEVARKILEDRKKSQDYTIAHQADIENRMSAHVPYRNRGRREEES